MTATGRGRGGQVSLVGLAWLARAACAGLDPAEADRLFFRSPKSGRLLCRGCPVREECLEYALDQGDDDDSDGVYGGTTKGERARIRYQRASRALTREDALAAHQAARTESVTSIAARLGVSRMTLYRSWGYYGLDAPTRQRAAAEVCEVAS